MNLYFLFYYLFFSWFFGRVSRKDAEKMLMLPSNPRGAFLIRNCEQTAGITKG